MTSAYDLLIIGGGINGAGIARDAAGRGLSVLLCEQDDLAGHTSSASTKLIHGGLRYLEYYEFRLVREALAERERLLESAPHIIRPLRFVLPHERGIRPAWLVRMGLLLYDTLSPRKALPGTETIDLRRHPAGVVLKPGFETAFVYSDCAVDDSRLVVLCARDAAERGAEIRVGTRVIAAHRDGESWIATLEDRRTGARREAHARILVNAAGPWVAEVLNARLALGTRKSVRLVKGSHIVVPRLYEGEHCYILQNRDRRIIFAIPYQNEFTLVGTTDVPVEGGPGDVRIDEGEVRYLCAAINHAFAKEISPADAVWTYSGVRPLYDDGSDNVSAVTRDYVFDIDGGDGLPPVLSIFGGKITTFRKLAEHALDELKPFFPHLKPAWTASAKLPGGDMPGGDFERFLDGLKRRRPFLPPEAAHRIARAYGTRVENWLGEAQSMADLGEDFGGGLTAAEVDYLAAQEWARSAEDILWRRSKLGLVVTPGTEARIDTHLAKSAIVGS